MTGEEILNGRKVWRIDAEPKANIKTASKDDQNALNTRRKIRLDQQDGHTVRHQTEYIAPTNGFQPGSIIDITFTKVGDSWPEESILFKYDLKAAAVMRGRGESRNKFYDFKLFQAESRLVTQ